MRLLAKSLVFSISCICVLGAAHVAQATTVTTDTTTANWGTYTGFQLSTLNPAGLTDSNRLNDGFRTDMYQSFTVGSTFKLTEFDLHIQPINVSPDIRIRIYSMASPNAASPPNVPAGLGSALYDETFDMATAGWTNFDSFNIQRFALDSGEQFTMTPGGYVLEINYVAGTGSADPILRWSALGGNPYAGGRAFFNTEDASGYDQPVALFGEEPTAAPEPSTYALGLFGLAGLGLVAWRRSRVRA